MVVELPPSLSHALPRLARQAGLGDRLIPTPAVSGLFIAVPFEALKDFRSAVAVLAERAANGRLIPWAAAIIDAAGRIKAEDGFWPAATPTGAAVFVHFLADAEDGQAASRGDLQTEAPRPALNLAA